MITLFIGRFQPFHLGHYHDIRQCLSFSKKVIIAIGSSQESNTKENPYSFEERKKMIEAALKGLKDVEIHPLPDVNDDKKWLKLIKETLPHFDLVFTGNDKVREICEQGGLKVKEVEFLPDISATDIRKRMALGKEWKHMVPKEVSPFLVPTP